MQVQRSGYFSKEKQEKSESKRNLFCKFCQRTNHTEEKCWKKHGYPPNFKFSKGKKMAANVFEHVQDNANSSHPRSNNSSTSPIPGFTADQCYSLLSFLAKNMNVNASIQHQTSSDNPAICNFAGPFTEEATGSW